MIRKKILKNREEWLANRTKSLGGSEISAVIGTNPYMTNEKLWELKTGRREPEDISDKPFVKYGNDAEPLIRDFFALDHTEYEVFYEDNNSFTNDKYKWAKASLDGWLKEKETGRTGILEIKTSEPMGATGWAKWNEQIPDNYYCQLLFYMAVMEADFAILRANLKSNQADGTVKIFTREYKFEREKVQEDIDYLMESGAEFWKYVEEDKRPPLILM